MDDRTASAPAPRKTTVDCPSWCEFGGHTHRDPHRASIGTICAPGYEVELGVQQYARMGRVTPQVEVVLTLDTTTRDGRPAGRQTLALPLPPGTDVDAFLADSDHEPASASAAVVVAPGITFEPYRRRAPGAGQRPARPGETCTCGRPAAVVFITERFGDVGYCGVPHPAAAEDQDDRAGGRR